MTSWLAAKLSSLVPTTPTANSIRVQALWVFPIKSCRGFKVDSALITPQGLQFDRQWMICDAQTHRFLTARTIPKMILIETEINETDQTLRLTIPATTKSDSPQSFAVSLQLPRDGESDGVKDNDFSVWADRGLEGFSVGSEEMRNALSDFMGRRVLLIRKGNDLRPTPTFDDPALPVEFEIEPEVSFADQSPILIVSNSSLAEIQNSLQTESAVRAEQGQKFNSTKWLEEKHEIESVRFRGNILLEGAAAWEEESWQQVEFSSPSKPAEKVELVIASRCGRCQLPNVNPQDAIRDPVVPDRIMEHMKRKTSPGMPTKLVFGVHSIPKRKTGRVSVGDHVTVTRRYSEINSDGNFVRFEDRPENL